jgi:hypothetical protein
VSSSTTLKAREFFIRNRKIWDFPSSVDSLTTTSVPVLRAILADESGREEDEEEEEEEVSNVCWHLAIGFSSVYKIPCFLERCWAMLEEVFSFRLGIETCE